MFDTKFVIIVREDLAVWQKLNVTAFLSTGIAAAEEGLMGEDYRDRDGNVYYPLCAQPIIVLGGNQAILSKALQRAVERGVPASVYVEEMFSTGHDAANRAVFAKFSREDAKLVGIAFRAERKVADKISKGAKMHP
ncbi:DUF2000 family protein [Martelella lutilitoris]|uniref:DUF2000 family protein n=1 Tax=Martelella lutilitoris TaxID=2583532 RepID=A0A5C4JSK6_9HYPH|nr:DUF2000 family protein [Martelella lutilitoris]TNB48257.1 DUF2000 family protein [Martelella lutilitoris]